MKVRSFRRRGSMGRKHGGGNKTPLVCSLVMALVVACTSVSAFVVVQPTAASTMNAESMTSVKKVSVSVSVSATTRPQTVPKTRARTRARASFLKASVATTSEDAMETALPDEMDEEDDGIIPITVISGFLGSGKTTLLQHLLENKSGDCPVGVIVNDVADVNIDGKLVSAMENPDGSSDGLVELENGCACCALSDELLNGVSELVTLSDLRQRRGDKDKGAPNSHLRPFKHIVVEMSGVSDPRNIRATFQEAEQAGMPLMSRIRLDTMVTVVDAEMFENYFRSDKSASLEQSPQLFREDEKFEMEDWMEDVPPDLLRAILGHRGLDESEANGVADLLVGQTETADVVLLNKCDLLITGERGKNANAENANASTQPPVIDTDHPKLKRLRDLIKALNPRPTTSILESSYGQVPLSKILGVAKGYGVTASGAVDDHREFVDAAVASGGKIEPQAAASAKSTAPATEEAQLNAAVASVVQTLSVDEGGCGDPNCASCGDDDETATETATVAVMSEEEEEESSSHAHSHDHAAEKVAVVSEEGEEESSSHAHSHDHSASTGECTDPSCTDPSCESDHDDDDSHSHSHSHGEHSASVALEEQVEAHAETEEAVCTDPGCTEDHDHSHQHSHSHSHAHSHAHDDEENSTHAGIGTFVYRARRPFHPQRMLSFLRTMPIVRGIPDDEEVSTKDVPVLRGDEDVTAKTTLDSVLRSKGFIWGADSHSNSMYWSHAGASFEYKCLGRWWATLPRDQWPEGVDEYVLRDFDDTAHPSEGVVVEEITDEQQQPTAAALAAPETVGDRRQELVFIGLGFGQKTKQQDIRKILDRCLLSEDEYKEYRSICFEKTEPMEDPDELLQQRFPTVMDSEYVNY